MTKKTALLEDFKNVLQRFEEVLVLKDRGTIERDSAIKRLLKKFPKYFLKLSRISKSSTMRLKVLSKNNSSTRSRKARRTHKLFW